MEGTDTKNESRNISEDFLSTSTLHGINKLSPSVLSTQRRLAWFVVILVSAAILSYTVITELRNYYAYPTITNIRLEQEAEIEFPAVTICNLSPLKKSAQPSNDPRYHNYMGLQSHTFSWAYSNVNWSDAYYQSDLFQQPITKDFILNISFTVEDQFFMCYFDAHTVPCKKYLQPIVTEVGTCFTFNKDGHIKTKRIGANFNFMIYFFIQQYDYYYGVSQGSGLKFIIHHPSQAPDVYSSGFVVGPGTIAYAAMKRHVYQSLPYPYISFANDFCLNTEDGDFHNPNKFSNYSVYSCIAECILEDVKSIAGCATQTMFTDEPFCSFRQTLKYYKDIVKIVLNNDIQQRCRSKCPSACRSTDYDVKLSYAGFPSDFASEEVRKLPYINFTNEFFRQNSLMLNVYYETLQTTYWEKVAVYNSVGDVLAKVGGQMGLFLGASLLTLTELFEFFLRLIYQKVRLLKMTNKIQAKPEQ